LSASERLPTFNAGALENDLWLYVTLGGSGVPPLAVWYSVRRDYRVNLLSAFSAEEQGNP
jgi:hypothetical protein